MKKSVSIVNCILSVFIFLCVYGNTCYRFAFSGKGGSDFGQQVVLCCYFAISVVIAIYCICANPYYSNKCFWVGAVYCMLYPALRLLSFFYSLIAPDWQINSINWLHWLCIIIPPIISGLYFYVAVKKD
ncbi:MAG: hypothetical protein IJW58_01920 [Clostridia bacterium]|nr:hypothetical protein [Clostridia bacterium]